MDNLECRTKVDRTTDRPADAPHQYDKLVETEVREHGQPFILGRLFFFKLLSQAGHLPDRHAVRYFGRRFRALTTKSINLKPYASELLTLLRNNGCKLAIVSNTEEIVTSHDLDQFDMRRHFETVVLSSVVGVSKPDPRIFRIALQRLGVLAQECLFVGDDYDCDYRGPERVGLRPVLLCDKKCNHHSRAHCVRPAFREIVRAISNPTESACAVSASV